MDLDEAKDLFAQTYPKQAAIVMQSRNTPCWDEAAAMWKGFAGALRAIGRLD